MTDVIYVPTRITGGSFTDIATPGAPQNGFAAVWNQAAQKIDWSQFEPAGAAATAVANHVATPDPHTGYLLASGSRAGAASQAQAFTNGLIAPSVRPAADSATALQWQRANGTPVVVVDTTNGRVGIGTSAPIRPLHMAHSSLAEMIIENTATPRLWGLGVFSGNFSIADRTSNIVRFQINSSAGFQFNSAAGAPIFTISNTGALTVVQPIVVTVTNNYGFSALSGAAGSFSGVSLGRASIDGVLVAVHSAGGFSPSSAQGDLAIRADTAGINLVAFNNAGEIRFASGSSATVKAYMTNGGWWSLGGHAPTALLDLAASTAARASLRMRAGVAPTTPNDGDIWYDGTHFYGRAAGVTKQLDN